MIRHGSRHGIQYRGRDGGLYPSVVRTCISCEGTLQGDLGDKFDDATQDAWRGSHWTFGKAVLKQADALVAARWLYLLAAKEGPEEYRTSYEKQAGEAAYYLGTQYSKPADIIMAVIQATRKLAPRASGKAQGILAQIRRDAAAAPASVRKQKDYHRDREVRFTPAVREVTAPPVEGWMEQARVYAPWAVGGVGVLVVLAILLGRRRGP